MLIQFKNEPFNVICRSVWVCTVSKKFQIMDHKGEDLVKVPDMFYVDGAPHEYSGVFLKRAYRKLSVKRLHTVENFLKVIPVLEKLEDQKGS